MGFKIKGGRLHLGFVTKAKAPANIKHTIKYITKK